MEKPELVKFLINNFYDNATGFIDLSNLDFGEYSVDISRLKTAGHLFQYEQTVSLNLEQYRQTANRHLRQNEQTVKGNLFQDKQRVSCNLYQDEQIVDGYLHQDQLKRMTKNDIENELGYKIIIEEE